MLYLSSVVVGVKSITSTCRVFFCKEDSKLFLIISFLRGLVPSSTLILSTPR